MYQNEQMLFYDWHWGESLNYLNNIINNNNNDNAILVSGESDNGKTTLKQEIISLLPSYVKVFSMNGEPKLGVTTFMRQITLGFGLSWDYNLPPDWGELRRAMFSQPECKWLLLIDDAEKLSWDTLNALINLYATFSAEGSQFNLILFAEVSFLSSIQNTAFKDFFQNKFHTIELQPLKLAEMLVFISEHMQLNFDRHTLKRIYNASNGVIGKVKQLAMSELNIKNTEENLSLKNLVANIGSPPVIRILVCASLLFIAYILFSITQKKEINYTDMTVGPEAPKVQLVTTTDSIQYDKLYQKLHDDLNNNLREQLEKLQSDITKLQEKITTLSVVTATDKPIDKISTLATHANINSKQIKQINSPEKQLLKIAKNRYVLQLMASKNEQTAKRLVNSYPSLITKVKYFPGKFRQQEDVWFVVVHGVYANRELAMQDVKNLPQDLQKLKPIVRDYAYIHQLINNNKSKN